jgi:hypothetical protein
MDAHLTRGRLFIRAARCTSTSRCTRAENVVHTGQLYFSDRVTDAVYRRAPYSRRPNRETRNADDSLFRNGGRRSLLRLQKSGTGYVGSITMGVRR